MLFRILGAQQRRRKAEEKKDTGSSLYLDQVQIDEGKGREFEVSRYEDQRNNGKTLNRSIVFERCVEVPAC